MNVPLRQSEILLVSSWAITLLELEIQIYCFNPVELEQSNKITHALTWTQASTKSIRDRLFIYFGSSSINLKKGFSSSQENIKFDNNAMTNFRYSQKIKTFLEFNSYFFAIFFWKIVIWDPMRSIEYETCIERDKTLLERASLSLCCTLSNNYVRSMSLVLNKYHFPNI